MDRIIEIIAIGILDYTKFLSLTPNETFIPSTRVEAVEKYNNDPFFNRTVDCIIHALIDDNKVIGNSQENLVGLPRERIQNTTSQFSGTPIKTASPDQPVR